MKKYKYMRSDFAPLPVRLEHMDINLNFIDDKVEGTNTLRITALEPLDSIRLDANGLQVSAVQFKFQSSEFEDAEYDYLEKQNALVVKPAKELEAETTFLVKTRTICIPSDSILEGIYRDITPPGYPQQYMSQCQQWGFQRILPVFDDCTAKCTMTTTIEADARYTHLVSNGNIDTRSNPEGKPVPKPGNPSRQVITYHNPVPMAPYLFIAAVGTWDTLEDEVTCLSGKKIKLEYLVPPARAKGAEIPMEILKKSIEWHNRTQDYEYRHDTYRTICMEKSNFGGMENVGNTTIITSAALIDGWTGDTRIKYAHGVIIHEFEHNQCGSDVTMKTPFDMWLNEAFTVDVERQFLTSVFDPDCVRLREVDDIRAPIHGPLSIEDGGHMGNIVRQGFNHPDELVDGVTYVKAAEVIRMLRLIIGPVNFKNGKNLYFERFNAGNADTDDFFACFEEISGRDLSQFKQEWLYTIGYPAIQASYSYDTNNRSLEVVFNQTRTGKGGLFHLPLEIAAVDQQGGDIPGTSKIIEITEGETKVEFREINNKPAFVSFNRNCSFYGTLTNQSSARSQLIQQVRLDPNRFNRVEAMRNLTEIERIKLINDINSNISAEWLNIYAEMLKDKSLSPGLKSYLLRIDEQSLDRRYLSFYRERYQARTRILETLCGTFMDELIQAFHGIDTYSKTGAPADGLEERELKAVLLRTIIEADTDEAQAIAETHFRKAWNITDRLSALSCIYVSSHPRRLNILQEAFEEWKDHLNAYTGYLAIIGRGRTSEVFDLVSAEETRPEFNIRHPGHNRALYMPLTANNRMLWTREGLKWLANTVTKLAPVNEYTSLKLVSCLHLVQDLADDLRPMALDALENILQGIDNEKQPALTGRIRTYLNAE